MNFKNLLVVVLAASLCVAAQAEEEAPKWDVSAIPGESRNIRLIRAAAPG